MILVLIIIRLPNEAGMSMIVDCTFVLNKMFILLIELEIASLFLCLIVLFWRYRLSRADDFFE